MFDPEKEPSNVKFYFLVLNISVKKKDPKILK